MNDDKSSKHQLVACKANVKSIDDVYSSAKEHLGQSMFHINTLFLHWLESMGVAASGQSDEHIELKKPTEK